MNADWQCKDIDFEKNPNNWEIEGCVILIGYVMRSLIYLYVILKMPAYIYVQVSSNVCRRW